MSGFLVVSAVHLNLHMWPFGQNYCLPCMHMQRRPISKWLAQADAPSIVPHTSSNVTSTKQHMLTPQIWPPYRTCLQTEGCRCRSPKHGLAFSSKTAVTNKACMHVCHQPLPHGAQSPVITGKYLIMEPEGVEARSNVRPQIGNKNEVLLGSRICGSVCNVGFGIDYVAFNVFHGLLKDHSRVPGTYWRILQPLFIR